VIRAFGTQNFFSNHFLAHLDKHTSCFFVYIATLQWLKFTLELLSDLYSTVVLLYFLFTSNSTTILVFSNFGQYILLNARFELLGSSSLGLAMSASTTLTIVMAALTNIAEVINQLVSAERVLEYAHLEPEAPLRLGSKLNPSWPKSGRLQMDGVVVAYKNGPKVLRDINLEINPGEKVIS